MNDQTPIQAMQLALRNQQASLFTRVDPPISSSGVLCRTIADAIQVHLEARLSDDSLYEANLRKSPYWFFFRICKHDAEVELFCGACEASSYVPILRGKPSAICRNCSFSNGGFASADNQLRYLQAAYKDARNFSQSREKWRNEADSSSGTGSGFSLTSWMRPRRENRSVPFVDAHLTLKQIRTEAMSKELADAFDHVYPLFASEFAVADKLKEEGYTAQFSSHGAKLADTGRYRRYAGGPGLGRGRYFSVCDDATGNDGSTMLCELSAYWSASCGFVPMLFDSTIQDIPPDLRQTLASRNSQLDPEGPLMILVLHKLGRDYDASRNSLGNADFIDACNITLETRQLSGVFDLRRKLAQAFVTEVLADMEASEHSDILPSSRTVKKTPADFLDVLPTLLSPTIGGSTFTDAIGSWLRSNGCNGIVFPSARRNAVAVEQLDIVRVSTGWNFVDFSGRAGKIAKPPFGLMPSWLSQEKVGATIRPVFSVPSDAGFEFAHGFSVEGVEERERIRASRELDAALEAAQAS